MVRGQAGGRGGAPPPPRWGGGPPPGGDPPPRRGRNNATNRGRVIHPPIGARGEVPRKVGIITPENEAYLLGAQRLQQRIAACDDHEPIVVTYISDIEQSPRQTTANIGALIDAGVTTVMFHADPIVPIFRTYGMTRQGYYPEHLMVGVGLLDYDKVGRLYDPNQWVHAFGPSHLNHPLPIAEQEASIVWRETGRSGNACGACQLSWSYYNLAASLIQMAGPNLTPQTVERGALGVSRVAVRQRWQRFPESHVGSVDRP
jgi:hypothetical protein